LLFLVVLAGGAVRGSCPSVAIGVHLWIRLVGEAGVLYW